MTVPVRFPVSALAKHSNYLLKIEYEILMQRLLKLCEEIEQTIAEIYRYWQQVFVNDVALSALWGRMADDELDHVRQVQLAKRVVSDSVFENSNVSIDSLEKSLVRVRQLLQDVQTRQLSSEVALKAAIKIEEEFSKAHLMNATNVVDASMKGMFQSLARADEQHVATLRNYCESVFGGK